MPEFQAKVKGMAIKSGERVPRNVVIEIEIKDAIDIQDARFRLATNWVFKKGIFSEFTFLTKPKFEIKTSETKPN